MSQYPEVFKKGLPGVPALRAPALPTDPPKSAIRLRPPHAPIESKEVQTSCSSLLQPATESREAETSTDMPSYRELSRPVRPTTVIKIPTPVPLASSGKQVEGLNVDLVGDGQLYAKLHSVKSWRRSLAQSAMRNAKPPLVSFDNEEIKGKLLPGDAYWRQTRRSFTSSRVRSRISARPGQSVSIPHRDLPTRVEGKPLNSRSPHRSRKSITVPESKPPPPIPQKEPGRFRDYGLGQASVPPQFALPSAYSQALGVLLSEAEKKHEVLQIVAALLCIPHTSVSPYRVSQVPVSSDFFIMTIGTLAPISRCCKAPLLVQLCTESKGKVMCTAWHCGQRTLLNFDIGDGERDRLWGDADTGGKTGSTQIQMSGNRSRSMKLGSIKNNSVAITEPHRPPKAPPPLYNSIHHNRNPSHDPNLFSLKDSITLKLQDQALRSFESSPIRRVLAKGGHRAALLSSLDELKEAWTEEG